MWLVYIPLILLAGFCFYNRFLHPLARIPGPFLASISPFWLAWQCMNHRRPRLDLALHKQYGSVVRISPNEIIFSNPAYFHQVYGAGTKFGKSRYYEAPTDTAQKPGWDKLDLLAETDVEKLRVQKRLGTPVYSVNNTRRHEQLIDSSSKQWFARQAVQTKRPVDFYPEVELLMVDTMCAVTFGEPYGAVEAGTDGGHMHHMWQIWKYWGWIGFLPWLNTLDKMYAPWSVVFTNKSLPLPVFGVGCSLETWSFVAMLTRDSGVLGKSRNISSPFLKGATSRPVSTMTSGSSANANPSSATIGEPGSR
nr:cytochrome p450 monooxygenase mpade [Quercus suber]